MLWLGLRQSPWWLQTTSPSYLLLASLDAAQAYARSLAREGPELPLAAVQAARQALDGLQGISLLESATYSGRAPRSMLGPIPSLAIFDPVSELLRTAAGSCQSRSELLLRGPASQEPEACFWRGQSFLSSRCRRLLQPSQFRTSIRGASLWTCTGWG